MSYDFGDVVLLPFPFTDQTATKKRPAIIVSTAAYNNARRDVVAIAVTSQIRTPLVFGEIIVGDWSNAGLLKPSVIKPVLTTIEQCLVLNTLGHLQTPDIDALR